MGSSVVHLRSQRVSVLIRCQPYAELLYWGHALDQAVSPENALAALQRPVPNSRLDQDVPVTLCPETGRGLFSVPGIEGHRDGQDGQPVFTTVNWENSDQQLSIISEDAQAGLRLSTELQLCPHSGILKTRQQLTNIGQGGYWLQRLAVTLTLPERAESVMAFHGRWINEFQRHRLNLLHGGFVQENRRGRTSHEYFPALVTGPDGFSEQQGEVWGLHLAWSGNHRLRVDCKSDGRRQIQAEALYLPGECRLANGECRATPWVYATWSGNGLNGMSDAFHQYVRRQVMPAGFDKPRPVHLNTWEGIYFDHQPDYIIAMARQAAELGVERFIIDDGWFVGRNDDSAALGDWYIDPEKYPAGLMPVIDAVTAAGMEFGIWVEPEMINENSSLYRQHPDWVLAQPGYPRLTGRKQLVLDLSNQQVFDYLLERLSWLLGEHRIHYVKWDFNRELVQAAHQGRASVVSQTEQVYRLFDELNRRFPQVEFESCASGGGRVDYEILRRCHRFWPSDSNDALDRQQIQRGASYFLPPEVLGTHIGGSPCHTTSRRHDIQFRGLTALFGHMGVELDPLKTSDHERQGFAHYIALHKRLRPLLHSGQAFRLDDTHNGQLNHGVVARDQSEAVVMVSQRTLPAYALAGTLRIPGLDAGSLYRLEILDLPEALQQVRSHTMKHYPAWFSEEVALSGEWLENVGIALPILDPESAILLRFSRQS